MARLRNPLISTQGVREAEGVLGDRARESVGRTGGWGRGEWGNGERQLGHPGLGSTLGILSSRKRDD